MSNPYPPLPLKTGKLGAYELREMVYPAGRKIRTATLRTAFIGGDPMQTFELTEDTIYHELLENGQRWMSDIPEEQYQHLTQLAPMKYGRVLVGGLGIGMAVRHLLLNTDVSEVDVVEISPEVIELVGSQLYDIVPSNKILRFHEMDLHHWLRTEEPARPYDFAFYDIWGPDSEHTLFDQVIPLRRDTYAKAWTSDFDGSHVVCWNENVMRGQLRLSLISRVSIPKFRALGVEENKDITYEKMAQPIGGVSAPYWNWACPFFEALLHWGTEEEIANDEGLFSDALNLAETYADLYGFHPLWRDDFDEEAK